MCVFPYRWKGADAAAFARHHDAVLAVSRLESTLSDSRTPLSLSPAALLTAPVVPRLVLPSPNGSTITTILDEAGAQVVVGCFRNAGAVAEVIAARLALGGSVAASWDVSRVTPTLVDGDFQARRREVSLGA